MWLLEKLKLQTWLTLYVPRYSDLCHLPQTLISFPSHCTSAISLVLPKTPPCVPTTGPLRFLFPGLGCSSPTSPGFFLLSVTAPCHSRPLCADRVPIALQALTLLYFLYSNSLGVGSSVTAMFILERSKWIAGGNGFLCCFITNFLNNAQFFFTA